MPILGLKHFFAAVEHPWALPRPGARSGSVVVEEGWVLVEGSCRDRGCFACLLSLSAEALKAFLA